MRAILVCSLLAVSAAAAERERDCPLVPVPKVYRDSGEWMALAKEGEAAIVVGAQATEPERYAASRLQTLVERRCRQRLPILKEDDVPGGVRQVLLLGQRSTHAWIDRLCSREKIDLGDSSPGEDGFVIEPVEDGARQVVLVGGSNPPGVIYGQNALVDLFEHRGGRAELRLASVRDWPSIRWRGRPHWRMRVHLAPGAFDSYARYRLNFTDVRDAGTPDGYAAMGFPPGFKIDVPATKRVIDEAHRRGMFVYGTVSCGVKADQYDAALGTFEELIALGVDGIWISLDDVGAGEDAPVIIRRALDLGAAHAMTGRRVANTQPVGSYDNIDTDFNRLAAAIPGYAATQWFFTRVPCRADLEATRKLGLKLKPAWWHNLFSYPGGFLYNANAGQSLREDGKPAYFDMQPLSVGWGRPDYEALREAADYTDTVMLWGMYDGWPDEYQVGAMGIWAWNPAEHDWTATRRAVYSDVYGRGQAETALAFDDLLGQLKGLFEMPVRHFTPNKGWPPRLRNLADRPRAAELIEQLEPLRKVLEERAPGETLLDPARLNAVYLEPLAATLDYARKMASLDYPEYTLGSSFDEKMIELYGDREAEEAEKAAAEAGRQVEQQLAAIKESLRGLKGIEAYADFWRKQAAGEKTWAERLASRRAGMETAFRAMAKDGFARCLVDERLDQAAYATWLESLASPPAGRLLAETAAAEWLKQLPRWQGPWRLGPIDWRDQKLTVIAFPRRTASKVGDYAEVRAELAVPSSTGRLSLDLFVNDTKIDPAYPRYRYLELWINDRLAWEEDITLSRAGREWLSVDVTDAAKSSTSLAIRFRVVDRQRVGSYGSVTFLGPLRLRAAE
jgi:hypothetical protein